MSPNSERNSDRGLTEINRSKLRQKIVDTFDTSDLKTLCQDLRIDYDELAENGKTNKARELIEHCYRIGRLEDLIAKCKEYRPHISWATVYDSGEPASDSQPQPMPIARRQQPSIFAVLFNWFGVEDDLPYRLLLRQIAVGSALFIVLVLAFLPSSEALDASLNWFIVFIFGVSGGVLALCLAETISFLQLVLEDQGWAYRILLPTVAGAVIGHGLFFLLTGEPTIWWFAGGLMGLTIAVFPYLPYIENPVLCWVWAGLVGLITAVVIGLLIYDPDQPDWWIEPISAVLIGIFVTLFIHYAVRIPATTTKSPT